MAQTMISITRLFTLLFCFLFAVPLQGRSHNTEWEAYKEVINQNTQHPELRAKLQRHIDTFTALHTESPASSGSVMFRCDTRNSTSPSVPTSVDKLLPGDIKVIAALGDSISSGNGILAETLIDVILQERGRVFSAGGEKSYDEGVVTVANLLREYNKQLYGYSTGEGDYDSEEAKFNVAVPGAKAPDMPTQADYLITRIQNDPKVDFNKDWKMVTIFIGGNDLCRVCDDRQDELGSAAFVGNMESALNKLAVGLPRTIVSVVPIMDVTPLTQVSSDLVCDIFQEVACPCATNSEHHEELKRTQAEYSALTQALIEDGRYDKDQFTVVFQPFLRDAKPPKDDNGWNDISYFSPDCFHFSEKGHQAIARVLWNSLFTKVGSKVTTMTFKEDIQCPAKATYIATNRNSKSPKAADSKHHDDSNEVVPDVFRSPTYEHIHKDTKPDVFISQTHELVHPDTKPLNISGIIVGTICGTMLIMVLIFLAIYAKNHYVFKNRTLPVIL